MQRPAKAIDNRGVRRGVQLLQQSPAMPVPFLLELRKQRLSRGAISLVQRGYLLLQVFEDDVEVSHRP
jgi:hypothetical protein